MILSINKLCFTIITIVSRHCFAIITIITIISKVLRSQVNPLTPMSDEDRISPYNINTISSRQVVRIKKYINLGIISRSNTKFSELTSKQIVWLTVKRITNLIWELKSWMSFINMVLPFFSIQILPFSLFCQRNNFYS